MPNNHPGAVSPPPAYVLVALVVYLQDQQLDVGALSHGHGGIGRVRQTLIATGPKVQHLLQKKDKGRVLLYYCAVYTRVLVFLRGPLIFSDKKSF